MANPRQKTWLLEFNQASVLNKDQFIASSPYYTG